MARTDPTPTPGEVKRILAAAADVLFSDGVADEFLDQWTEETVFLLSLESAQTTALHPPRRR
jgi:hypothetical protein